MLRKIIAFVLTAACVCCLFAGCGGVVTDVADNVLAAAKEELVSQIKEKVQQYKVTAVETKAAVGTLNDDGGKYQFYCAILVQTNAESSAADCAKALKGLGESGYMAQTGSHVDSEHLVHKTITYDRTDFSEGNYYTVYVYIADITKVVDLSAIRDAIQNAVDNVTGSGT